MTDTLKMPEIKAERINAVQITLADGQKAVLVQDGPEWNRLRRFKCIAPA